MIVAYEFAAWDGYLFPALFSPVKKLAADIAGPASVGEILREIPDETVAFAFQINLTKTADVPPVRRDLVRFLKGRGIFVINETITDISKRHIQTVCRAAGLNVVRAGADGDPDEVLIVKTDRNYGGIGERDYLTDENRRRLNIHLPAGQVMDADGYIVAPRKRVPADTFANRDLVVERFIANRSDTIYRVYLLGRNYVISVHTNPHPIKKSADNRHQADYLMTAGAAGHRSSGGEKAAAIAEQVDGFCAAAGLTYGTLDIVEDDRGRFYIVDVNDTPKWFVGLKRPRWFDHLLTGFVDFARAQAGANRA